MTDGRGDGGPRSRRPAGRRRPWTFERLTPYLMVLPVIAILAVFRLYPLVLGINFSFTGDGEIHWQVIGLDRFDYRMKVAGFHE